MSNADTWMPFYVGDYLSATGRLTTEQHGAYLLILLDYWKNGPPPDDDAVLAQLARVPSATWRKMRPALLGFFEVRDGVLIQKRVERERSKAGEITEKRSKAGKASAAARAKATHVPTDDEHMLQQVNQQTGRPSQSHKSSEGKPSGQSPSSNGPVKDLFELGVAILIEAGSTEKEARSLIGKWKKAKGEVEVMKALLDCQRQSITNPVEWLAKRLNGSRYVSKSGYEYRGDLDAVIRESEKRADWSIHWQAKADRDGRQGATP